MWEFRRHPSGKGDPELGGIRELRNLGIANFKRFDELPFWKKKEFLR